MIENKKQIQLWRSIKEQQQIFDFLIKSYKIYFTSTEYKCKWWMFKASWFKNFYGQGILILWLNHSIVIKMPNFSSSSALLLHLSIPMNHIWSIIVPSTRLMQLFNNSSVNHKFKIQKSYAAHDYCNKHKFMHNKIV